METTNSKIMDRIISGLKNAATELEEFQLQLALGKAEATDKYEEVKKNLHTNLHEAKIKMQESWSKITGLKSLVEELELLLTAEKTTNKEAFNEQKQKIFKLIADIEDLLKINDIGADVFATLRNDFEKFKIKMEILSLRFELGKMEFKQEFEERKSDFGKKVNAISQKFSEKEAEIEKHLETFGKELTEAYQHLKSAFLK